VTTSQTDPFPITLHGKLGTATVRSQPKRVITLGDVETDTALALGVTPLAASADIYGHNGVASWELGKLDPSRTTLLYPTASDTFDLEQIAALHPDLILGPSDFNLADQYTQLSSIAPTVGYKSSWNADSWQSQVILTGEALGRKSAAVKLVNKVTSTLASYRRAHRGLVGKTYTFSELESPSQIATIVSPSDRATSFFTQLGMHVPLDLQRMSSNVLQGSAVGISLEEISKLNANVVFLAALTPNALADARRLPTFDSLPAGKSGHVKVIGPDLAIALRTPTPLSLPWALRQLSPTLTKVAAS
jgi:iron complex transport system substrate-binding protein